MLDRGLDEAVLGILVLLKTTQRKGNPRVSKLRWTDIDESIEFCLSTKREYMIASNKRDRDKSDEVFRGPRSACAGGLQWNFSIPNQSSYWNFADAARVLRTSYLSEECPETYPTAPQRHVITSCFRRRSVQLLDKLQVEAWSEVRASVFLTLGTILPPELAERIFEKALEAEEIPASPSVLKTPIGDSQPDAWKAFRKRARRRGVKKQYTCCHIDKSPL